MFRSDLAITIAPEVNAFLSTPRKMLIDGQWVDAASDRSFAVYDPATGEVIASVPEGEKEDIDRAVRAERTAFDSGPWRKMTTSMRGRLMNKLADLMEQHAEEFAQLESLDNGKPASIARVADVPLAIDMFRYMAGWATKIEGNTIPVSWPGTYFAYTLREPVGVVGQIIPWNFPLLMAAWKLGPALATGCTIVLKDADLDTAIIGAANAIFFNHGQCCCAGSRLYIERDVFDRVVDGVAEQAKKIKLGHGLNPETQMGPLVSDEQLTRVTGYLHAGLRGAARPLSVAHRYTDTV